MQTPGFISEKWFFHLYSLCFLLIFKSTAYSVSRVFFMTEHINGVGCKGVSRYQVNIIFSLLEIKLFLQNYNYFQTATLSHACVFDD